MEGKPCRLKLLFFLFTLAALFSSALAQENTADYWMKRADGFFNTGSSMLAIKSYEKVLEHDPMNASALYKKGIMLSCQYAHNESIAAFNAAINLSPDDPHVWNAKGIALYVDAKLNEAIDDQLIDLNSERTAINDKSTHVKTFEGSVGSKEAWEYAFNVSSDTRRIASGLYGADNHSELLMVFENPRGEPEIADIGSEKIGPIQVVSPENGQWKLKVYGYTVPHIEVNGYSVSQEKSLAQFKIRLINQSYSVDRFNMSLDAFNEAIKLDSQSLTPLIQKALVLMESGRFKEASETIENALKIDPSNSKAWYTKGLILIRQGNYENALKSLSVSTELASAFADAWHYKGIDLKYLGRNDEADIALNNSEKLGYTANIIVIPTTTEL